MRRTLDTVYPEGICELATVDENDLHIKNLYAEV